MDNLSKRATLVSLKSRKWTGRCVDKQISQEVLYQHSAKDEAGSFSKRLVNKDCLKEISRIMNQARNYYKEKTLAWEDGKFRLLPVKFATEFMEKMREYEAELDIAVKDFINSYDEYKEQAKDMLNGMYNEGDYPSTRDLVEKFSLKHEFQNISDPEDFRCEVSDEIKEQIRSNMKNQLEEKYTDSMKRLYERIYDVIKNFNEKLKESLERDDFRFFKAMITNIEDLVAILPDMNLMDDEKLTEMTDLIQKEICRFDIKELKHSKESRDQAIKASSDILTAIERVYA